MEKVLVTGAAGSIGLKVINGLLKEDKYEITALDLNNKKTAKNLKKYRNRINIVYGDITDSVLISSLIKDHDIVINLSSCMPPLSDYRKELSEMIEYKGVKNIIHAINKNNKKCTLIYASTTSIYGDVVEASVKSIINKKEMTPYNLNKYEAENAIKKGLNNYVILRVPLVLNNIVHEPFMFNIKREKTISSITNIDAANAFVKCIDHLKKVNKKVYNISGGENFNIKYDELINKVLKYYGVSIKYIMSRIFLEKNYYSPLLTDGDELNKIIKYQSDTMQNWTNRLKRRNVNRGIGLLFGKLVLLIKKKR